MYSHTVLLATLPQFICTAAIRKIIVTLFVKQDDILNGMNLSFIYVHVVCLGFILICYSFIPYFFLLSPCTF
jgi:hypothetical protein